MRLPSNVLKALLSALVIPMLAACSIPTPAPLTDTSVLQSFKPLAPSKADTCPTQQQIAEHNSRYDTLKTGKDVAYKAWCDLEVKAASAKPTALPLPAKAGPKPQPSVDADRAGRTG